MSRRAVLFLMRLMPLDARGRRVVDEIIADWDHEAALASGGTQPTAVDLRGASALAGAIVLIAIRELKDVPTNRALWTTVFWLATPFAAMLLLGWFPSSLLQLRSPDDLWRIASVSTAWTMFVLPPALFAGAHRAGRAGSRVPYLGLALAALAVPVVQHAVFWLLLVAGPGEPTASLPSTPALPEEPELALERTFVLQLRLSLWLLGPAMVLLAGQLRRVNLWQARLTPLAVAVGYITLLMVPLAGRASGLLFGLSMHAALGVPWLLLAAGVTAIVVAASRDETKGACGERT